MRRFADHRLLLCRSFPKRIADYYQPGGDPDLNLQLDRFCIEATHSSDHLQPRPDRALDIVLMGPRIAEKGKHPLDHIFDDKPVEIGDGF